MSFLPEVINGKIVETSKVVFKRRKKSFFLDGQHFEQTERKKARKLWREHFEETEFIKHL